MKKKFSVLALSAVCLLSLPGKSVLAAGAELPENFDQIQEQESKMSIYDIHRSFSSYQGERISHTYNERQSNGDVHYYRGYLNYVGKDGFFGPYHYLGDKRDFDLYKIVKADGTVIEISLFNQN